MTQTKLFKDFIEYIENQIHEHTLLKLTLSKKRNKNQGLQNIFIKPILIQGIESLNTVFRYKTNDITKNLSKKEVLEFLTNILSKEPALQNCDIFTTFSHVQCKITKDFNSVVMITSKAVILETPNAQEHNNIKCRLVDVNNPNTVAYLKELGLAYGTGKIIPSMQHKYKQINKYVEILQPYLDKLQPKSKASTIYDMGSGKGYLSFSLADYCNQTEKNIEIRGIEMRQDMVDICNGIASRTRLTNLTFETGKISDYFDKNISLDGVMALHACDTATDEAIYMGVKNEASLIVVAPCCHRQIRKNIVENKSTTDLAFLKQLTKHGILLERQAELATDAIRALLLEIMGYKVKVVEFVNLENTPKNLLIIATKKNASEYNRDQINKLKSELKDLKTHFGVTSHYLELLLVSLK
jgi:hypothetical protein